MSAARRLMKSAPERSIPARDERLAGVIQIYDIKL